MKLLWTLCLEISSSGHPNKEYEIMVNFKRGKM